MEKKRTKLKNIFLKSYKRKDPLCSLNTGGKQVNKDWRRITPSQFSCMMEQLQQKKLPRLDHFYIFMLLN